MRQVVIEVTQDDINKGKKHDSTCCPVALACLRTINKNWMEVWQNFSMTWDTVPKGLYDFIIAFDKGQVVKPFKFTLTLE